MAFIIFNCVDFKKQLLTIKIKRHEKKKNLFGAYAFNHGFKK